MKADAGKVLCFGEMLMRISPSFDKLWLHHSPILAFVGGAELNTATALAQWGIATKYFTALPDNYLSREIASEIDAMGIDASAIQFSGERFGIYYLPRGVDLKNAGVIYDRENTSFATLKPNTIDWDFVLSGCSRLHLSAICPALNQDAADVAIELVRIAAQKNIVISIDLNYRSKLWKFGKKPVEIMPEIVQHASLMMGNLWAVENLLGISSPIKDSKGKTDEELVHAAWESMRAVKKCYSKVDTLAYTFRFPERYFAVMQHNHGQYVTPPHALGDIKDPVGSGDCFMAGLIYGIVSNHAPQHIVDFAAAAAIGKLQERDDATSQTVDIVEHRMEEET